MPRRTGWRIHTPRGAAAGSTPGSRPQCPPQPAGRPPLRRTGTSAAQPAAPNQTLPKSAARPSRSWPSWAEGPVRRSAAQTAAGTAGTAQCQSKHSTAPDNKQHPTKHPGPRSDGRRYRKGSASPPWRRAGRAADPGGHSAGCGPERRTAQRNHSANR